MSDKKQKQVNQKHPKQYLDLFYMTPSPVEAKDIAELLSKNKELVIELWPEMNVLELELPNRNTIDFEPLTVDFKDPSDHAFVKNRRIQAIYGIQLAEEDLDKVKRLFEQIIEQFSGFLCTDSADFHPIHVGSAEIPSE